MKKFLLCLLTVAVVFSVCSCKGKIVPYVLPSPKIISIKNGNIEWDDCVKAEKYEIVCGDKTVIGEYNFFYYGSYSGEIKIRALGDGKYYADSPYEIINV